MTLSKRENKFNLLNKKRNGGPYSKIDRHQRQNEVYKLHFEYGFTARRIAEMMKVSRNTVNGDISYWFNKIVKNWRYADPEVWVVKHIDRLEQQRTRIRTSHDKANTFQEKLAIEKLILEIDSKILQTQLKLGESRASVDASGTRLVNDWLKRNGHKDRVISYLEMCSVSGKAQKRILKILNEDRKRPI